MKLKKSLFCLLVPLGLFSCCQKDSASNSGTTNPDQSYIQYADQRLPLTDGEYYAGGLSLYDADESHTYEIDVTLWNEQPELSDGSYTLTASSDDNGMAEVALELTENQAASDSTVSDTTQPLSVECTLASANMKISSTEGIYTISIAGFTADSVEVRAHYVGRLYFADKKKER